MLSSSTSLSAVIRSFRSIAPLKTLFSSTTNSVEMLSFFLAWLTRAFIACFTVMSSSMIMQFVVILLPISSSSNEAISLSSLRTSGATASIIRLLLSLSVSDRIFTAVSVSSSDISSEALWISISLRYSPACFSSRYSNISASISRLHTR